MRAMWRWAQLVLHREVLNREDMHREDLNKEDVHREVSRVEGSRHWHVVKLQGP